MPEKGAGITVKDMLSHPTEAQITLQYHRDELKRLWTFVQTYSLEARLPKEIQQSLDLALTEWVTNVISYACPEPRSEPISIHIQSLENGIVVNIEDSGKPFNPTEFPDANTQLPLDSKPIGGLGIHLMRQLMDHIEYERTDQKNRLRMFKLIPKDM